MALTLAPGRQQGSTNLGLAGVGAGAGEGSGPHGGGGAESALAQTKCGGHCCDEEWIKMGGGKKAGCEFKKLSSVVGGAAWNKLNRPWG